jgi:hypothetical protein
MVTVEVSCSFLLLSLSPIIRNSCAYINNESDSTRSSLNIVSN